MLYLCVSCNLPKEHTEVVLKTLGWTFGPGVVLKPSHDKPDAKEGHEGNKDKGDGDGNEAADEDETESNTHVPLSQSLETLLKQFGIKSNGDQYVIGPNMSCIKLHLQSTLPHWKQACCSNCKTDLMKAYVRKDDSQWGQMSFKPALLYTHYSLIKQLEKLLSHPDIVAAIHKHKAHLQQPDCDPKVKEDIQHGNVWLEFKGPDSKPFFTLDGDEIGLILTLDKLIGTYLGSTYASSYLIYLQAQHSYHVS
ncbi:hypothetical protein FRC12_022155 [Ceratobasidium sp. 428]|nr:hypothetical protein FRC12_022155 [Ceratobasidium sp. 428]